MSRLPSVPIIKICESIKKDLQIDNTHPREFIDAFEFIFDHLDIGNGKESATIFYLLTVLLRNKFIDGHKIKPSTYMFSNIAKQKSLFNKPKCNSENLQKSCEGLFEKGIISRIFFSKNDEDLEDYFPVNPKILWTLMCQEFSSDKSTRLSLRYKELIEKFSEQVYDKKFGIENSIMNNNFLAIEFNTQWMIYFILTYAKENSNLYLLLSKMRTQKEKESLNEQKTHYFYNNLIENNVNIQIILDGREKNDVKNAKKIRETYSKFQIKYNYRELNGTSRRIILKTSLGFRFSVDATKILSKSNPTNNTSYYGILYTDDQMKVLYDNFQNWWGQSTDAEQIEKKILDSA